MGTRGRVEKRGAGERKQREVPSTTADGSCFKEQGSQIFPLNDLALLRGSPHCLAVHQALNPVCLSHEGLVGAASGAPGKGLSSMPG